MKILHVGLPNLPADTAVGGAVERRMRVLATKQAELGHEVYLVSPEHPDFASIPRLQISDKLTLNRVPITRRGFSGQLELGQIAIGIAREKEVDVVHVHNASAVALSIRKHEPFSSFLSIDYGIYRFETTILRFFWSWLLSKYDCLLPVSIATECMLVKKRPKLEYRVLYNLVDETFFSQAVPLERYRQGGFVFGFLGRINEQKGADLLADAFSEMKFFEPDTALLVAGPSGTFGFETADPCVEKLRNSGAVLLGSLNDRDLPGYLSSIDCLVVPTRRDERFGMVAAEAMACNCPVVTSGNGGLPEVVDQRAGINAETSATSLALAMRLMICQLRTGNNPYEPRESSRRFWSRQIAETSISYYQEFCDQAKI